MRAESTARRRRRCVGRPSFAEVKVPERYRRQASSCVWFPRLGDKRRFGTQRTSIRRLSISVLGVEADVDDALDREPFIIYQYAVSPSDGCKLACSFCIDVICFPGKVHTRGDRENSAASRVSALKLFYWRVVVGFVPIGDLRTGPELNVASFADCFEDFTEIFQPMWRAHDVGMYNQSHNTRRLR
jgi:hypothetical protein